MVCCTWLTTSRSAWEYNILIFHRGTKRHHISHAWTQIHPHAHTHMQRGRERERDRGKEGKRLVWHIVIYHLVSLLLLLSSSFLFKFDNFKYAYTRGGTYLYVFSVLLFIYCSFAFYIMKLFFMFAYEFSYISIKAWRSTPSNPSRPPSWLHPPASNPPGKLHPCAIARIE